MLPSPRTGLLPALALLAVTAVQAPASAAPPAPVALKPVTAWNLDATEQGCALRRGFGNADRPLILEMRRFSQGSDFQLTINGDELGRVLVPLPMKIRWGDQEPQVLGGLQLGTTVREAGQKRAFTIFARSRLAPEAVVVDAAMEAATRQVELQPGKSPLTLATGSLGKPFAMMRECTDALVASWGLNPAEQALAQRPQPIDMRALVKELRLRWPGKTGDTGRVNFRLLVDASGQPTACTILKSYNDAAFDKVTCSVLMTKVRFQPAINANGAAIASYYTTIVSWTIR